MTKPTLRKNSTVYQYERVVKGKRIRRSTGIRAPNRKDADKICKRWDAEIDLYGAKVVIEDKIKAEMLLDDYLRYCKVNKKEKTWKDEKVMIDRFFDKAHIFFLNEITTQTIQKYTDNQVNRKHEREKTEHKTLSLVTVNTHLKVIKTFCSWLVREGYLSESPARYIKKHKIQEKQIRFLSPPEIQKLEEAAKGSRIELMLLTALDTGARINELINLKWADIDFKKKIINIQSNERGYTTKSKKNRHVPITKLLYLRLKAEKKINDYVFTYKNKRIKTQPKKSFQTVIKKAKLNNVGWHTLRKTFASNLIINNVGVGKVAKWLGHADVSLTYKTYGSLLKSYDKEIEKTRL